MASLDTGGEASGKKGPGVKKAKKLSTRVDMTPMVDLGFLLITFFIFTATLSTPTTMDLNVPKDTDKDDEQTEVKQSGALTIMLGKENQVFYYEGELLPDGSNFLSTNMSGIRDIILKRKKSVIDAYRPDPKCEAKAKAEGKPVSECFDQDLTVVIKPDDESTYKNTVDILDEMTINMIKRFALVKISQTEKDLIAATQGANPSAPAAAAPAGK